MRPIPLNDLARHNGPLLNHLESAIGTVLRRGYFVLGPENEGFEKAFADYLGVPASVGVGNGTDALELALRALAIGPGDEVITVANAGMYASTAIRAVGAEPHYVDVEAEHLLIDVGKARAAVGPATRALIATHLFGRMADVAALRQLCDDCGIALIEDCAQAHGARRDGRMAGAWGDLSAFSFYPTKNLGALGDGGLVAGRDLKIVGRLRQLRQYGWSAKYQVTEAGGRNSRLDELQAAVLRAKLPLLDGWNERRRTIVRRYLTGLAGLGWGLPAEPGLDDVCHLFVVQVAGRDHVRQSLANAGVGCDVHYPILDHHQTAYVKPQRTIQLPVSEAASTRILTLPCFPELSDEEVDRVVAACRQSTMKGPFL